MKHYLHHLYWHGQTLSVLHLALVTAFPKCGCSHFCFYVQVKGTLMGLWRDQLPPVLADTSLWMKCSLLGSHEIVGIDWADALDSDLLLTDIVCKNKMKVGWLLWKTHRKLLFPCNLMNLMKVLVFWKKRNPSFKRLSNHTPNFTFLFCGLCCI